MPDMSVLDDVLLEIAQTAAAARPRSSLDVSGNHAGDAVHRRSNGESPYSSGYYPHYDLSSDTDTSHAPSDVSSRTFPRRNPSRPSVRDYPALHLNGHPRDTLDGLPKPQNGHSPDLQIPCPFGTFLNLDFVEFCNNLGHTNLPESVRSFRKAAAARKKKWRKSMEQMLYTDEQLAVYVGPVNGHGMPAEKQPVLNEHRPSFQSPVEFVLPQKFLENALNTFEETLHLNFPDRNKQVLHSVLEEPDVHIAEALKSPKLQKPTSEVGASRGHTSDVSLATKTTSETWKTTSVVGVSSETTSDAIVTTNMTSEMEKRTSEVEIMYQSVERESLFTVPVTHTPRSRVTSLPRESCASLPDIKERSATPSRGGTMVPAEALESVREKLHAGLREMQRLQAQADLVPILQAEVEALKRKRAEMTVGTQTSEAIQRPALPEWLVSRRREEGELLDVLKQVAVREMSPLAVARVRAVLEGISRRDALEKATETEEVGSGQRRCSDIGVQSDDLLEDASLADSGNCESEEVEQLSIESPQLVDFGIGTDSPAMICIETWTPPAETNETATNTDPLPTPPPTLIRKAFRTPKKSPKQISHKKRRNSRQKKPVPTNAYENPLIIEEPEIPQETPAEPVDNVENGEKSADKPEVTESIAENGHREESAEKLTPSVEAVRPVSEDDPLSPAVSTHSEELSEDEGSYDLRHGYLSNKCGVEEKPSVTKIFTFDDYEAVGVISKEVMAACKVLNDYLQREGRSNSRSSESSVNGSLRKRTNKIDRCIRMIEEEWFRVAGQKNANAQLVNDYLDAFELMSKALLHKVVNLADNNGNTVLHYAISQNHFDVVSVLLDSKVCDVDSVNRAGYTATMLASLAHLATNTDQLVAARLFKLGDINRKAQQHGQTALMLAVSHGRLDTVRLLLQVGADVNIQDDDGSTALMCASEHGHLEIVRLLLGHPDTDAHLTDKDGMCALYVALEAQHKDIAALIYARTTLGPGDSLSHLRPPTVSASSSSSNEPHEVSRIPRSPTVPLKAPKRDTNGSGHGPESGRFGFTRKLNHTTSTM